MVVSENCPKCASPLNASMLNPSFFQGNGGAGEGWVVAHGFLICPHCYVTCAALFPVTPECAGEGAGFFAPKVDARTRAAGDIAIKTLIP